MPNRGDIIASGLLILLGIAVVIESIRLQVGTITHPQPGFFPFVGGLLLIGLAVVLLVQGWLKRGKASRQPREPLGEMLRPVILIVSMSVYTVVLEPVGYLLPTILMTAVILRILGVTSWRVLGLSSLGLSVGTYLLFGRLLGVDLPSGVLPFLD